MDEFEEAEMLHYLLKAVNMFGSKTEFAKALGVNRSNVFSWCNRNKKVSIEKAIAVEKLTNGEVTRYQLRPDIFKNP